MNTTKAILALLAVSAAPALGQLSQEQKVFEFQALASVYVRHYAPYEWKRDAVKFDAFDLKPWLDRVRATRNDLDFYEVCALYVSSLDDAHSSFSMPSNFGAILGFSTDIYDGKVVVDSISRALLPASRYPFQIGDELVSIDDKPVAEVLDYIKKFTSGANPRSTARIAAARLTSRSQFWLPRAHEIGEEAVVGIRRRTSGEVETYRIPWTTSGTPITVIGRVPSPGKLREMTRVDPPAEEPDPIPDYMQPIVQLARDRDEVPLEILNYGATAPVWRAPQGFQQRPSAFFISGSYMAEDRRIGFIRIPNFSPGSTTAALRQFETEIAWMQDNTDGLIVDVMRNTGGDACYNEEIQRRLIPYTFRGIGREIRATRVWVNSFSQALELARQQGAEPHVIALLEARLKDITTAYSEARARTGPLPICTAGLERIPADIVYRKPLMVLIDEFSTSAADAFPAVLQDARRALLFGMRTRGAGGTIGSFRFGVFSEAFTTATVAMHHRLQPVVTPDYPTAPYVENIGVRPDIEYDYMTIDNLLSGGSQFVGAFTGAMLEHIRQTK